MLRGLVIRQIFVLVDVFLAVLVLLVAAMVVLRVFQPVEAVADFDIYNAYDAEQERVQIASVKERSAYDSVVSSGMFGRAGTYDPAQPPPPPPPEPEPEEATEDTQLNLQLMGTTATSPTSRLANAIIMNLDQRDARQLFFVGQDVMENVTLEEVYPREVILLNKREAEPKRERLRMDNEDGSMKVAEGLPAPAPRSGQDDSSGRVMLNRQEFIQELYTNYADLVTKIKPEYFRDASGQVIGLTAQNISQVPLARKLNLSDGDVLQSVNNEVIDSEQKVLEIIQKYRNASSFRIGILRNGKPQVITYRLE